MEDHTAPLLESLVADTTFELLVLATIHGNVLPANFASCRTIWIRTKLFSRIHAAPSCLRVVEPQDCDRILFLQPPRLIAVLPRLEIGPNLR